MNSVMQAILCLICGVLWLGVYGPQGAAPFFAATFICLAMKD